MSFSVTDNHIQPLGTDLGKQSDLSFYCNQGFKVMVLS